MAKERKIVDLTKDAEKGRKYDLSKDGEELSRVRVDLTWKSVLDLDATAFLVGEDGITVDDDDFVYYKSECRWLPKDARWEDPEQRDEVDVTDGDFAPFSIATFRTQKLWRKKTIPVSSDGGVLGSWDDLGSEDDNSEESGETMHALLDKVRDEISEIVFCITIHPSKEVEKKHNIPLDNQTFDKVREAKVEISDPETGEILINYDLKDSFMGKTAVEVGRILKDEDGEWEFLALGEGHTGGLKTLIDMYV